MTLHEAIKLILEKNGNLPLHQITNILNEKGLYQRRDNSEIPRNQVSARISKYQNLFQRNNGIISLV